MNRIDLKDKTNFIGSWNIDNNDLCKRIIEFFENNKNLQKKGTTVSGVNEKVKKSIDLSIDPKKLNNPEFVDVKDYFSKLFECYQDYKIQWPFLDKTLEVVDIPKFNIQKYNLGGHFSSVHCERDSKQNMHRTFAWMTYLNDVDEGGETYFEHFNLKIKPKTGQTLIDTDEGYFQNFAGFILSQFETYPKGLIPFFVDEKNQEWTAFEAQLIEAIQLGQKKGMVPIHLTIDKNHRKLFDQVLAGFQKKMGIKDQISFDVQYSYQHRLTDTPFINENKELVRDDHGEILFRKGGHGSLLENINQLDADCIWIKNCYISNVIFFDFTSLF